MIDIRNDEDKYLVDKILIYYLPERHWIPKKSISIR
jgi:hypothetical protein